MVFEYNGFQFETLKNGTVAVCGIINQTENVRIPSTASCGSATFVVTEISDFAFSHDDVIQNLVLPRTITQIGKKAFVFCENLVNVDADNSGILMLKEKAFAHCKNLKMFNTHGFLSLTENCVFSGCKSIVDFPCIFVGHLPFYSFHDCKNITSFTFSHLESIDNLAFRGCDGMKKIVIAKDFDCDFKFLNHFNDVQICCRKDSVFADLAYEGYNVQIKN